MTFLPVYLRLTMNNDFRKLNTRIGWGVFFLSAIVYLKCIEPTASFWDCGEYIACSHGIETGHPPGAPLFLLIAKFFSLFSFGKKELVAPLINGMSAIASAFTILFLFWSITHLAKKIMLKSDEDRASNKKWIVLIAGIIGALSYAFTDSFWFSAEEGEVYALSSFFTAIVFWAMLKWEEQADDSHSKRWLIFIAYMIGLSVGVHLLNLLTIPALVFIYYFRRAEKIKISHLLVVSVIAVVLLGFVQDMLIPGVIDLAGKTELLFVNKFHFRFNSGTYFYFSFLVLFIGAGIYLTRRKIYFPFFILFGLTGISLVMYGLYQAFFAHAPLAAVMRNSTLGLISLACIVLSTEKQVHRLNTVFWCFAMLLIGYSSFFVLAIRAQAGTPINEDAPKNSISMLSYLNREQYGDWPLMYGPYYNSPLDANHPTLDGDPTYVRSDAAKKYIVSNTKTGTVENYDSRGCTLFPRMYSSGYTEGYKSWVNIKGYPVEFKRKSGSTVTISIPTFGENFQYFITYQCGWMYARYFAWNFIGRQNDLLGYGNESEGNVLTGFPVLDDMRLGDQKLIPDFQKKNKSRNKYFGIPLLLGIFGFFWHLKNSKRDTLVITLLFLFTGLAIVFYLNQTPWQPRERDYAYVGSFYAFAVWIGFGFISFYEFFLTKLAVKTSLIAAVVVSALSPIILFTQNIDDHNRSGRTVAVDLATNFLNSCEKNAILFTYADNDTFPLWYAQEVLGVRRDVRIVCLNLFRSDWYIDQMKQKNYTSDPLPITLTHWQYREGMLDYLNVFNDVTDTMDLNYVVNFLKSDKFDDKYISSSGDTLNYIAGRNMSLAVNKKNILAKDAHFSLGEQDIADTIYFRLRGDYLSKDQTMILDILAHNDWKRPVYFAVNMPVSSYDGLDDYLRLEGMAYRLVPQKNKRESGSLQQRPQVLLDKSYNMVMNDFRFGGLRDPKVLGDETVSRMFSDPVRTCCAQLATALLEAGEKKKALDVVRKCTTEIPANQSPPDNNWIEMINVAWKAGDGKLATDLSRVVFEHYYATVRWFMTMPREQQSLEEMKEYLFAVTEMASEAGNEQLTEEFLNKMQTAGIELPAQDTTQ
ncbi:MAG: DUF2723 domain-containing protein [Bacteroidetes bacterium]|nr:DUF2723 domain-containing protein [Bacteroidota bacterium]